jgi:hypothetical protein
LLECKGNQVNRNCSAVIRDLCAYCPNVLKLECRIRLAPEDYILIATSLRHLTRLSFTSYESRCQWTSTKEQAFLLFATSCQSLVELSLEMQVPYNILSMFLKVGSPKLRRITVEPAVLGPKDCATIASRYPALRYLHVSAGSLQDADVAALAMGCPCLETVAVCGDIFTNANLLALARNGVLKSLNLFRCSRVTDQGLQAVIALCPLLEKVDLRYCIQFTDPTLTALGQRCPHLCELIMNYTSITHIGLQAVAAGCPLLARLGINGCRGVARAVTGVARSCPHLQWLVADVVNVPSEGVLALAECCPLLEDAYLPFNKEIGDEEITALVRGCAELRRLDIYGTSVTELGLRAIREHCKKLYFLGVKASMYPGGLFDENYFPPALQVEHYPDYYEKNALWAYY